MYKVNPQLCLGCGACEKACPSGAISMQNRIAFIEPERCRDSGRCVEVCPQAAISREVSLVAAPASHPATRPALQPTGAKADWVTAVVSAIPVVAGVVAKVGAGYMESRASQGHFGKQATQANQTRHRRRRGGA
jgi:NAD-dependent dihydropyrimidine dehydrogenase PreA subunit